MAPAVALYAVFLALPVLFVAMHALGRGAAPMLDTITEPSSRSTLVTTVRTALEVTAISGVLAILYAGAMQLAAPRWRKVLVLALLASLLASLVVRTYAWIIFLGAGGPVVRVAELLGVEGETAMLLYTRPGVLIGMVHFMLPLFALSVYAVMSRIPRALVPAARTLGANQVEAWLRVTFPLLLPGIAAGAAITFIMSAGFFVTPAFLGGRDDTMIAQVIDTTVNTLGDIDAAAAVSLVLVLVVLLCILLFRLAWPIESLFFPEEAGDAVSRLRRRRRTPRASGSPVRFGAALGGPSFSTARRSISTALSRLPWPGIIRTAGAALAVFFVLPYVVMVPVAFTSTSFITFPPEGLSLRWFTAVLQDATWVAAAGNSLAVGLLATLVALLSGVPLAWSLSRGRSGARGRGVVLLLAMVPMVVPVVVLALGQYVLFLKLGLTGSLPALALPHALLGVPVVVIVVISTLRDYDVRLDQAARSLGARPLRVFFHITLPLILPAVVAGALFTFFHSFDELLIAKSVTQIDGQTLPVKMYAGINQEVSPALAAVSTLVLVFTLTIGAGWRLVGRARPSRGTDGG